MVRHVVRQPCGCAPPRRTHVTRGAVITWCGDHVVRDARHRGACTPCVARGASARPRCGGRGCVARGCGARGCAGAWVRGPRGCVRHVDTPPTPPIPLHSPTLRSRRRRALHAHTQRSRPAWPPPRLEAPAPATARPGHVTRPLERTRGAPMNRGSIDVDAPHRQLHFRPARPSLSVRALTSRGQNSDFSGV